MSYVFGPVPSRRLGLSLGVDLIPPKTCTFDCLYCEVGRTTEKVLNPKPFIPVEELIGKVERQVLKSTPDTVTLAGSGEPTLNPEIGQLIASIRKITEIPLAILTNGSLFWKEEIRSRVLEADIILPTLTSVFDNTFRMIHRPHPELEIAQIIDGLEKLRRDYKGQIFLEVVLLAGMNDSEKEIEGLKAAIDRISPDKIQLNTVARPPADSRAISLDIKKMEEIMIFLGEKAEIVARPHVTGKVREKSSLTSRLLEMVKRRPLKTDDIAKALGLSSDEVEDLVNGMLSKEQIRKQEYSGDVYYKSIP
ncbi:MAG: radical SAM protein [Desulfobacterales bacterium]|nr:radical SAM protein [Desulfobacterales bacterium]